MSRQGQIPGSVRSLLFIEKCIHKNRLRRSLQKKRTKQDRGEYAVVIDTIFNEQLTAKRDAVTNLYQSKLWSPPLSRQGPIPIIMIASVSTIQDQNESLTPPET